MRAAPSGLTPGHRKAPSHEGCRHRRLRFPRTAADPRAVRARTPRARRTAAVDHADHRARRGRARRRSSAMRVCSTCRATSRTAPSSPRHWTLELDSVFHLAAVVSGAAEADFDLGMRVNLDGTRALLDACRARRRSAHVRVREFGRGVRRRPARRRRGPYDAGAAVELRRAEADRRTAGRRLHAPRLHRRPRGAPADDRRATGQAQRRGVELRQRHHPRAAGGRRSDLSGRRRRRGCG